MSPAAAQSRFFDPKLFARAGNLELTARMVVEGMLGGRHRSAFHGFSVEFSEHREYTPGDDLKHLDWKALARGDKVYVKRHTAETNLKAWLALDVSASMGYQGGGPMSKLDYASYCAAAIAHLALRQQDAAGLVTFDHAPRSVLQPRNSPAQLRAILTALDRAEPAGASGISAAFHGLAERMKRRGLIVVLSDFLDDPARVMAGLAHFRRRKHEVVLFHIIDPHEADFPFSGFLEFEDMETGARLPVHARLSAAECRRRFADFQLALRRRCAEHRVDYAALRTDEPVEIALARYLARRSRLG